MMNIIPQPRSYESDSGAYVLMRESRIYCLPEYEEPAALLALYLRRASGYEMPVSLVEQKPLDHYGHIWMGRPESGHTPHNEEHYLLKVWTKEIVLQASSRLGIIRGVYTTLQLFPAAIFSEHHRVGIAWAAKACRIEDYPEHGWRGMMLDCARYFRPKSDILRFLDAMAQCKFNRFHWHLTDDQGWRVEVPGYPQLTEIGAYRKGTIKGHHQIRPRPQHDGQRHGGYYSRDDIHEVAEYARVRGIELIPEVGFPCHCTALLASYPELSAATTPLEVATGWGIFENIVSPLPESLDYVCNLLHALQDMFPTRYFHLGGDEIRESQWKSNEQIRAYIEHSAKGQINKIGKSYLSSLASVVADAGKQVLFWEEALIYQPPQGSYITGWFGDEAVINAAKQEYTTINCSNRYTYFDYYQDENIAESPIALESCISLDKVFYFNPRNLPLGESERSHIIGAQAQLWGEFIPDFFKLCYMAFPRSAALAESLWLAPVQGNFTEFKSRLEQQCRRWAVSGINHGPC